MTQAIKHTLGEFELLDKDMQNQHDESQPISENDNAQYFRR